MALDRQSIERRDFPIGRRGYDPEAVDAHLAQIAAEVEELKLSARRRTETLASTASERVRAIIEAAEASASGIQGEAEKQAREIRTEAAAEADSVRGDATSQARMYVARVSEATSQMRARLDAMQTELGTLIDALRTGSNRLGADLQLLESGFDEVRDAVGVQGRFEREVDALGSESESAEGVAPAGGADRADGDTPTETEQQTAPDGNVEGARLVALNMALNGTPREETARYLAEKFSLSDRDRLLDEVYTSAGD